MNQVPLDLLAFTFYLEHVHAYLIIGQSQELVDERVKKLALDLNAKLIEQSLGKIEDVRSLTSLIRLHFENPTLFFAKNINDSSEEALNAFLKNLEEPGENIFFALSAPSKESVLSTIVSRCQIINVKSQSSNTQSDGMDMFTNSSVGEKIKYIDKIKNREEAINFIKELINFLHRKLITNINEGSLLTVYLEASLNTLKSLQMNANISLQLTNLVARMENANGK